MHNKNNELNYLRRKKFQSVVNSEMKGEGMEENKNYRYFIFKEQQSVEKSGNERNEWKPHICS